MSAEPLPQHSAAPSPTPAPAAGVHAPVLTPLAESASRSKDGAFRAAEGMPDKLHRSRSGRERLGQLVTAAIGLALTLAMGLVLLFGYRSSQTSVLASMHCRPRALCKATPRRSPVS